MFGYVRPLKGDLKVAEYEMFRAVYCGLCHALKRRYGWFARFALNYDLAFFAAAADGLCGAHGYEHHRCISSPFRKKCLACASDGQTLAADLTVVLAYWKLDDAVRDGGGIAARLLRMCYKPYYRKALRLRPELCRAVEQSITELSALENQCCDSIDRTADAFARILSAAARALPIESGDRFAALLYHVGRWIYIIDAFDDLADDAKTGAYNPVALRWQVKNGVADDAVKQAVEHTLGHSLDAAYLEFRQLDFFSHKGFVDNVLRAGLPMVTTEVLCGRFKQRRKTDERPL